MSNTPPDSYFPGVWDTDSILVITCSTIAIYNSFELLLLVFTTFKEWGTLYFVSLLVASIGVIPYCIGFMLEYFRLTFFWLAMMISSIGWTMLITGQAFVLYSRLGLILENPKILKAVKWMIIIDAIIFHGTITAIQYGRYYGGEQPHFADALFYMEKIQMTGFCIQEFIISGLYVWKTFRLLKVVSKQGTRRVMWELFIINVVIIIMDIALLVLEYHGLRTLERAFKSFIYSVKLKLEFAILGKLVDLSQSSNRRLSNNLGDIDAFVDISKVGSIPSTAHTHAAMDEPMPRWMMKLERKPEVEYVENINQDPALNKSLFSKS